MILSRSEIETALKQWQIAWENYDLEGVMALFHEEVVFVNWTGARVSGKEALCKAWQPWFENHGNFRFVEQETFIDEKEQKVLYRWQLDWPSRESGYAGKPETRSGVDVMHFKDGMIIHKFTYSKTSIEIDGQRYSLHL